jgi:hypothetical protein
VRPSEAVRLARPLAGTLELGYQSVRRKGVPGARDFSSFLVRTRAFHLATQPHPSEIDAINVLGSILTWSSAARYDSVTSQDAGGRPGSLLWSANRESGANPERPRRGDRALKGVTPLVAIVGPSIAGRPDEKA